MRKFPALVSVAILSSAVALTGCSSSGPAPESVKAVHSLNDYSSQIGMAKIQVDRVVASLDNLNGANDINRAYEDFTSSLNDLKSSAATASNQEADLRAKREAYLAKWAASSDDIRTPEIKDNLERRHRDVREEYDKVLAEAQRVRDMYTPFIARADELHRALALDLTVAGVNAQQGSIDRVRSDGKDISSRIDTLNGDIAAMTPNVTPEAVPASSRNP